jgi:hypothetical protein
MAARCSPTPTAHKRVRNLEEAAQLTYRALAAGVLSALPECPAVPASA